MVVLLFSQKQQIHIWDIWEWTWFPVVIDSLRSDRSKYIQVIDSKFNPRGKSTILHFSKRKYTVYPYLQNQKTKKNNEKKGNKGKTKGKQRGIKERIPRKNTLFITHGNKGTTRKKSFAVVLVACFAPRAPVPQSARTQTAPRSFRSSCPGTWAGSAPSGRPGNERIVLRGSRPMSRGKDVASICGEVPWKIPF